MKIKAVALWHDKDPEVISLDNHVIQQYYDVVEGWLEAVRHFPTDTILYCNEDGLMKRLPPNYLATELFTEVGVSIGGGLVLGNVIAVGAPDRNGDDTDVPPEFLNRIGLDASPQSN